MDIITGEVCKVVCQLRDWKIQIIRWMDFKYSPHGEKNDMTE